MTLNQQNPATDAEVEAAIDTVARQVIARLVDWHIGDEWEHFPDIGEHDWQRVQTRCLALADFGDPDEYAAAYALLDSRAEHTC